MGRPSLPTIESASGEISRDSSDAVVPQQLVKFCFAIRLAVAIHLGKECFSPATDMGFVR